MSLILSIQNLCKSFGDNVVLHDISLDIEKGDIYGILGLSGAGKSTLVRCINGLEVFDFGKIVFYDNEDPKVIATSSRQVSRDYKKRISMIFQSFNLLEQRTVLKNVEIAGEINGDSDRHNKAEKLIDLVGLSDKKNMYPSTLSGGQKQRVAIARALMNNPDVLLCDEATSALDAETTESILDLLKDLNKKLGLTVIIIAHQISVIERICNKVAILDKSRIVENGYISDIFLNPQSDLAKRLIYSSHVSTQLSLSKLIRLKFSGYPDTPIITNIVQDCNMLVSIVYASTKLIDGSIYGQIIIRLPYYDEDIYKLKHYLEIKNISYEEVVQNESGEFTECC